VSGTLSDGDTDDHRHANRDDDGDTDAHADAY
jgi:hypothetical protein